MENFNFKKYLAEGKLLNEAPSFNYPQEILDMDTEIEDLKAKLQAAITAKNKAKSNYTKSVPSLSDQGEFAGLGLSKDKRSQYEFKDLIDNIKRISEESGNDWDELKKYLKSKYPMLDTYTRGTNPAAYVVNFFAITKGEDKSVKENPKKYIKIGDWYVRPW
jgi:hypothetical protein